MISILLPQKIVTLTVEQYTDLLTLANTLVDEQITDAEQERAAQKICPELGPGLNVVRIKE